MNIQSLPQELIQEWDYEKNIGLEPTKLNVKAKAKLWWRCNEGHSWMARLDHRKRGSGCPYCTNQKLTYKSSLACKHPEIAAEWHPSKNGTTLPADVSRATSVSYWWRCTKGHEWLASVSNRTRRGDRCPYCSGKLATIESCLFSLNPGLAKEWNHAKNLPLTPFDVTCSSNQVVWWICKHNHEWKDKISARDTGNRCKWCFPRKLKQQVSHTYNLEVINPELSKEWNLLKNNGLKPSEVTPGSGKKVWWTCRYCEHNWKASIDNRNNKHRNCPRCNAGNQTSFHEQCIYYYLSKIFRDCQNRHLITIGMNSTLELDIYIPSLNVAIEYDGYFYHKHRAKQDVRKNIELHKLGIHLIRIRENNGPDKVLPDLKRYGSIEMQHTSGNNTALADLIKVIIIFLENKYYLEVSEIHELISQVDIDIDRDYLEVLNLIRTNKKERSLCYLNPDLANEWHPSMNHEMTPLHFTPGSNKRVWWLCPRCLTDWHAIINKRVNGQSCRSCISEK